MFTLEIILYYTNYQMFKMYNYQIWCWYLYIKLQIKLQYKQINIFYCTIVKKPLIKYNQDLNFELINSELPMLNRCKYIYTVKYDKIAVKINDIYIVLKRI
jgi:hypothetical protein